MRKLIYTISFVFMSFAFGSDSDMDTYYAFIDEEYPVLSAHQKNNNYGKVRMRKRSLQKKKEYVVYPTTENNKNLKALIAPFFNESNRRTKIY